MHGLRALLALLTLALLLSSTAVMAAVLSRSWRRLALGVCAPSLVAWSIGGALPLPAHAEAQPQTQSDLYGLRKGRLMACKAKSNCISTSSINSLTQYGRPWTFEGDASAEFDKVMSAARASEQFLEVAADSDRDKGYVHLTAKAFPSGIDDLEFLINPADKLITYRTNSREVVFAGNQKVPDGGSQKNRLQALQRKLGAKDMGDYSQELFDNSADSMYALPSANFFRYQKAASEPSDINFLDNKVVEAEAEVEKEGAP